MLTRARKGKEEEEGKEEETRHEWEMWSEVKTERERNWRIRLVK